MVGPEKKEITVHAAAITKQSDQLKCLIYGGMNEALTGRCELPDVLEDTFIRFCQFAYTGNYETPAFNLLPKPENLDSPSSSRSFSEEDPPEAPPVVVQAKSIDMEVTPKSDGWGFDGKVKRGNAKLTKSRKMRNDFDDRQYDISMACADPCEIRENEDSLEDYTPVFLGHARLYIFAEERMIDDLKTLCLHKLHKTLMSFTLYEDRRTDIVELVRYAYAVLTKDMDDDPDGLRALVTHYVTCEADSLIQCSEFLDLVGERGSFAKDLLMMVMKRVDGP